MISVTEGEKQLDKNKEDTRSHQRPVVAGSHFVLRRLWRGILHLLLITYTFFPAAVRGAGRCVLFRLREAGAWEVQLRVAAFGIQSPLALPLHFIFRNEMFQIVPIGMRPKDFTAGCIVLWDSVFGTIIQLFDCAVKFLGTATLLEEECGDNQQVHDLHGHPHVAAHLWK